MGRLGLSNFSHLPRFLIDHQRWKIFFIYRSMLDAQMRRMRRKRKQQQMDRGVLVLDCFARGIILFYQIKDFAKLNNSFLPYLHTHKIVKSLLRHTCLCWAISCQLDTRYTRSSAKILGKKIKIKMICVRVLTLALTKGIREFRRLHKYTWRVDLASTISEWAATVSVKEGKRERARKGRTKKKQAGAVEERR